MITLTDSAVEKVKVLLKEQDLPEHGLRLFVSKGGCSEPDTNYQYGMSLEPQPKPDDEVLEQNGLKVFVDKDSGVFLSGMVIDYGETHLGKGFIMRNPNAVHTCGCGHTFSPKDG